MTDVEDISGRRSARARCTRRWRGSRGRGLMETRSNRWTAAPAVSPHGARGDDPPRAAESMRGFTRTALRRLGAPSRESRAMPSTTIAGPAIRARRDAVTAGLSRRTAVAACPRDRGGAVGNRGPRRHVGFAWSVRAERHGYRWMDVPGASSRRTWPCRSGRAPVRGRCQGFIVIVDLQAAAAGRLRPPDG